MTTILGRWPPPLQRSYAGATRFALLLRPAVTTPQEADVEAQGISLHRAPPYLAANSAFCETTAQPLSNMRPARTSSQLAEILSGHGPLSGDGPALPCRNTPPRPETGRGSQLGKRQSPKHLHPRHGPERLHFAHA